MREFFRGWRRKVGCVSLVMGLTSTGLWIRSAYIHDEIIPPRWTNLDICFISEDQSIACQTLGRARYYPLGGPLWHADYLPDRRSIDPSIVWQWEFGGFRYKSNSDIRCVVVPYWALADPLVLIAAYLILWKPRKRVNNDA